MSAPSKVVAAQIIEEHVSAINAFLDKVESGLVVRGRTQDAMLGDYQNTLFYYNRMLTDLFSKESCNQHQHLNYLNQFAESKDLEMRKDHEEGEAHVILPFASIAQLFADFKALLERLTPDNYEKVMAAVGKTIHSRIKYFNGLQKSFIIGQHALPADVAWFHRNNDSLVKEYLKEHSNKALALPEPEEEKVKCDFREKKERIFNSIMTSIKQMTEPTSVPFYPPAAGVRWDASNYFSIKLKEPLQAIVACWGIANDKQLYKDLSVLCDRLITEVEALKPSDEPGERRSDGLVSLIQVITQKIIKPKFDLVRNDLILCFTTPRLKNAVPPSL